MRFSMIVACLLTAIFLSGCVYSVHPILDDSDLTTDIDLAGTWKSVSEDGKQKTLTFAAEAHAGGAEYDMSFKDKKFVAGIGKIGPDVHPDDQSRAEPRFDATLDGIARLRVCKIRD